MYSHSTHYHTSIYFTTSALHTTKLQYSIECARKMFFLIIRQRLMRRVSVIGMTNRRRLIAQKSLCILTAEQPHANE